MKHVLFLGSSCLVSNTCISMSSMSRVLMSSELASNPTNKCHTRSQFQQASSLLAQVSTTRDPETCVEGSSHPDWDTTINEEYHSLMTNDTGDLVPLPKRRKLVRCKWVYRTKYASNGSVERLYVDNLILTSSDPKLLNHVKSKLQKKFEIVSFWGSSNIVLHWQCLACGSV
jgi:hypothetical protein